MSDLEERVSDLEVQMKGLLDWQRGADVREATRHADMTALKNEVAILRKSVNDRMDRQDTHSAEQFRHFETQLEKNGRVGWIITSVFVAAVVTMVAERWGPHFFG